MSKDNVNGGKNAFSFFGDYLLREGKSRLTVEGYLGDLTHFAGWFSGTTGEEVDPAKVTSVDLREYRDWMVSRGLKPATVNRRLMAVKAWLKWAVKEGLAPRLPDFPKEVPQVRTAPRGLERAEVNRLLRELEKENDPRDTALVRLMLSCGLRISEAVSLRVEDVEIGERRGRVVVRSGKGEKWREVPLPPETRRALKEWLEKHPGGEWLFPGREGDHLSAGAAWKMVKKYAYRARIPFLKPHDLRHTFAYSMLRAGADLTAVADVLGHARLNTTAIYTRPKMRDLERFVEKSEV